MYKIYFDNRFINIFAHNEEINANDEHKMYCKNTKSFDKAYQVFINNPLTSQINIECDDTKLFFKYLRNKFKLIKAAGGLVLNENGELLVIKRNGFWDLPKGKIEDGEGKKTAAIREVEEECGISDLDIESKIGKTYHTYQLRGESVFKTTYWYRMFYNGSESLVPQIEEGITEVKWVSKEEIDNVIQNTYESLKPLFFKFLNL
jgi:8-oxo-dGTP pyrophosphatase MutT (NUDIX family)